MSLQGSRARAIITAACAALFVGALGALVTELGPWYYGLRKPSWQPPDWLFGPVWTLIFGLAAMAGYSAWMHARGPYQKRRVLWLFGLNAFFNVAWSAVFFRLHRPDWALVEVVFLWLSIVWLIVLISRIAARAAWLLAPYLAWVSFAAVLNYAVVRLNHPFV